MPASMTHFTDPAMRHPALSRLSMDAPSSVVPAASQQIVRAGFLRRAYRRLRDGYRWIRFKVAMPSGVSIDPTSWVARRSVIQTAGGGTIVIGRNCEIHDYAMLMTYGGDIRIGDDCSLNPFTIVYGYGGVTIGSGVRIA